MINILDVQDKLKNLSQQQLTQEMQNPSGAVPQYLVLSEISRRQAMQQSMQQQNAGKQTVAQELLNGAGIPAEGMSDMAQSMAPQSSIAQNTGIGALPQEAPPPEQGGIAALAPQQPTGMYAGGPVTKMATGALMPVTPKPIPQRSGPTPLSIFNQQEYLRNLAESDGTTPPEDQAQDQTEPTAQIKTGMSGTGNKMSTYEQMLADAMANADKKAKQDKWLALAQAGMSLMSSAQPNLGAALGEAGNVGIGALQSARDTAEKTKLQLAQEQYNIEEHKAALARSMAAAGASAKGKGTPSSAKVVSEVSDLQKMIDGFMKADPLNPTAEPTLSDQDKVTVANMMHRRDMLLQWLNQNGFGATDLGDTAQGDGSQ
jgi:hypothetical protein